MSVKSFHLSNAFSNPNLKQFQTEYREQFAKQRQGKKKKKVIQQQPREPKLSSIRSLPNLLDPPKSSSESESDSEYECLLDNSDLPPVADFDHFIKKCYWMYCECGQHVCPADEPLQNGLGWMSPTHQWKSSYDMTFKGQSSNIPSFKSKEDPELRVIKERPLEAKTTNKWELPEHDKTARVSPQRQTPAKTGKPYKFWARSSYSTQYNDWGQQEVEYIKAYKPPYRGKALRFTSKSQYTLEHQKLKLEMPIRMPNLTLKSSQPTGEMHEFKSHNQSTYAPVKPMENDVRYRQLDYCSPRMGASPQFMTSNKLSFQGLQPTPISALKRKKKRSKKHHLRRTSLKNN